MPSDIGADYLLTLVLWVVSLWMLLARAWGARPGVGLALAYWFNLALIHLCGGVLPLLPWFVSPDRANTVRGFPLTGYAMAGLLAGHSLYRARAAAVPPRPLPPGTMDRPKQQLAVACIVLGLASYFLLVSLLHFLPTAGAVLSNGLSLAASGCCFLWWVAYRVERGRIAWLWACLFLAFPVLTVLLGGFIGFGVFALCIGGSFLATYTRPRWMVLAGGAILCFLGLSLYIAYMGARNNIRAAVWGGAPLGERVETTVAGLQENWSWFDLGNDKQLATISGRLNQNTLVGIADRNLEERRVHLIWGETLYGAVIALVPRAVWPGKPAYAGSGDLVTRFTGVHFAAGTSVGIGHVMELYVNFGIGGLVVGFGVIGFCLAFVDARAGKWLAAGNVDRFLFYFVPGQALLMVGGTFAEILPCAVGGLILCLGLTQYLHPWLQRRS